MKKSIILSFIIMGISIFIGKILNDWALTIKICGGIGLISIGIVGLLNGLFVSGDRNRANYASETKDDRIKRDKITNFVISIGLPNIILAVLVFFVINKI